MASSKFNNPFRPGAGHMPPYLAGRKQETDDFQKLLQQEIILKNFVLTGLRGVGKTVLLETLKPLAFKAGWFWVGTDLSESTTLSEDRMAMRLMTDLAVVTSSIVVDNQTVRRMGFQSPLKIETKLDFHTMADLYARTNGLTADKLKAVLEFVWSILSRMGIKGVVFAYDEADIFSYHVAKDQYPLALLLDTFQSIQRKNVPFMLALAGLPTLFPRLVEARTYAERMFRVVFLDRLNEKDSREAIEKPVKSSECSIVFSSEALSHIIDSSGGYPYFIQFICREVFDVLIQQRDRKFPSEVNLHEITRKLDTNFFSVRWARATDRQRDLLSIIAHLDSSETEFTVQEIAEESKKRFPDRPFSSSHISQMLVKLSDAGLVYKNRHGKYSFAVPLLGRFIRRQEEGVE